MSEAASPLLCHYSPLSIEDADWRPAEFSNSDEQVEEIVYKPYAAQTAFHRSNARYRLFSGGLGSGKSHAGANEMIRRLIENPGAIGLVCAPTYRMLHDSSMLRLFSLLPDWSYKYKKSEEKAYLDNGSEIWFRSTEDPDKLRNMEVAFIWLDEAAMMPQIVWDIAIARARQPGYDQKVWATTTPNGLNWLYDYFIKNPTPDYWHIISPTHNNPYLPSWYASSLAERYSAMFAKQEIHGEFCAAQGLVYTDFQESVHVLLYNEDGSVTLPNFKSYYAGIDWGYRDPFVMLIFGLDYDSRMYAVDEYYMPGLDPNGLISAASAMYQKYQFTMAYADPSQPAYIQMFNSAGIPVIGANNDIIAGIGEVTSRLKVQQDGLPRLFIHPRCVHTRHEFYNYRYPEAKDGKPLSEKPLDLYNHCMDSMRYVCIEQGSMPNDSVCYIGNLGKVGGW